MNILDRFGTSSRCIVLMCLVHGISGSQVLFSESVQRHAEAAVTCHASCLHHFTRTVSAQLEEGTSFWVKYELSHCLLQPGSETSANHAHQMSQPQPGSFRQVASCLVPACCCSRLLPTPDGAVLWAGSTSFLKGGEHLPAKG